LALNISGDDWEKDEAEEIHDEYDIKVYSKSPEVRNRVLGALIADIGRIPFGDDGASAFEKWCHDAITKVFAGSLSNVALKPNKNATQRRDIVGTHIAQEDVWKWLRQGYQVRQVVFEVKNYEELALDDIRQTLGYLSGEYGTLGFVITRGHGIEPTSKENTWIREGYYKEHKLVVKLTDRWLSGVLGKLRNPEKYNVAADALQKQLDNYPRLYLEGQGLPRSPRPDKAKRKR
jgi:hypothetical protein